MCSKVESEPQHEVTTIEQEFKFSKRMAFSILGSVPLHSKLAVYNLDNGTRELTLKCKLKCYFKPMNNPLGVSPCKGKQGTTRGTQKIF